MTSKLLKEDDEFLYLQRYIHDDPDTLPDWVFDEESGGEGGTGYKYPENIVLADDRAAYELRMTYRIRKSNAEVIIDEIT